MPDSIRARRFVAVASALLAGCPVDQRTLTSHPIEWIDVGAGGQPDEDTSGSPDQDRAGRAGAGGADSSGAGGRGGGAGGRPGPGCGTDCATLVDNGTFDRNIADWAFDASLEEEWSTLDARGQPSSGSLVLRSTGPQDQDGYLVLGTGQCVEAQSGVDYHYAAQVWFDADQGDGSCGIELLFFDELGCRGTSLDTRTEIARTPADWLPVATNPPTPAGTRSLLLRLILVRPYRSAGFSASFDDVVLLER